MKSNVFDDPELIRIDGPDIEDKDGLIAPPKDKSSPLVRLYGALSDAWWQLRRDGKSAWEAAVELDNFVCDYLRRWVEGE